MAILGLGRGRGVAHVQAPDLAYWLAPVTRQAPLKQLLRLPYITRQALEVYDALRS